MFFSLSEPRPNGPHAAHLFLRLLGVNVTSSTLQREIEDHPDYPSLLSLSDVFSKYGVENITAEFSGEQLQHIPVPYIAQLTMDQGGVEYFTVVREIRDDRFHMFNPVSRKWEWKAAQQMQEMSTGVVLMAEPLVDAGEPDYAVKHSEERLRGLVMPVFMLAFLTACGVLVFYAVVEAGRKAWMPVLYFVASLAGVCAGVLLVWHELDRYNPFIRRMCKATKTINCNAILQSNASKIGGVSLSVIGLSYFAGNLFLLLFHGLTDRDTLIITGLLSILALPFTVFSFYYQWRIARQWCVLCLFVQGVLLLHGALVLGGGWISLLMQIGFPAGRALQAIMLYALPLFVLIGIMPVLKAAKEARWSARQVNRLKYDPVIFRALLEKQKDIHAAAEGIGIVLGTPGARNKIIKVCNPYCGPCAKAHVPIDELVHQHPDIELRIIFTASADAGDVKRLPVQHFLSIASHHEPEVLKMALDDWYLAKEKDYARFAAKFPVPGNMAAHDVEIAAMKRWCDEEGISGTPTIFVNNKELPELYNPDDLKRFFMA